MKPRIDDRQVTEILRSGDPALGVPDLSPPELARIRQRTLSAADEAGSSRSFGRLYLAASVGGALALVLLVWLRAQTEPANVESIVADTTFTQGVTTAELPSENPQRGRQILFRTRNGTRVVWILYADGDSRETTTNSVSR